ncbi:hypothetical protein [Nocardia arthritidis]|uniref:Uncharacterized protein n=1 Tax=Nocardia arthritidis TaxID=228602 RepID=A0A6G9YJG0_9NOCA|nr:hypothetical protein [Nocardia arthritidis]QIS13334.1 hypothetical protein F5544_27400 [Nocardia arthritidis]
MTHGNEPQQPQDEVLNWWDQPAHSAQPSDASTPQGGQSPAQGQPTAQGWQQSSAQGQPTAQGWQQSPAQGQPTAQGWQQPSSQDQPTPSTWQPSPTQGQPTPQGWQSPAQGQSTPQGWQSPAQGQSTPQGWQSPAQGQPIAQGWQQSPAQGQPTPPTLQQPPAPEQPNPQSWAQQAWQQPSDQPQSEGNPAYQAAPIYPAPPRKSYTGALVAVAVLVVAALGVAIGFFALSDRNDSDTSAADTTTAAAPTISKPPAITAAPGKPSAGHLSYTEYGNKDWDFKYDDVTLHADWVDGRDYADCHPIEKQGKLTALGCQYAAELVYKAENGGLMLTQFILGMGDEAEAAAAVGKYTDKDLSLRKGTYIEHFTTGKWKDGSRKEFVVVTFATATGAVDPSMVQKYLHYRNADTLAALIWR